MIGHGASDVDLGGIAVTSFGYIRDPVQMALIYSAADVFVALGRAETFGQIFAEAACGTPAVRYPLSGATTKPLAPDSER